MVQERIIKWLRQEVKKVKAKGIVLGLSGGIDSSVVAALAKSAVGGQRALGLLMPIHSLASDTKDAKLVASRLKIKHKLIDLSNTYDNLLRLLPKGNKLAKVNLKPRLRMATLYFVANSLNYLVVGTGNKSELMVGYFTKYGDGGVDLLPIGGLFKGEVKSLAKELDIPQSIIDKPPTAGLWPGQTDEGEMGITYDELDDILSRLVSKKKYVLLSDKVIKVKERIKRSEHKRQGPKICYLP